VSGVCSIKDCVSVMSSEPGGAQLALTAGPRGAGIYSIVKLALSEHARKRWERLVNRKDHELGQNCTWGVF